MKLDKFILEFNLQIFAGELAGYENRIKILTGSTAMAGGASPTGSEIEGVDSSSYGELCDILDITSFGDAYKNRMGGLKDTTFTIAGNVYVGDTTGQDVIVPGDTVMIGTYPSGTGVAGKQVKAIVESMDRPTDVAGKQTFSATFSCIAAPVELPLIS